jgi:hypothetical protein
MSRRAKFLTVAVISALVISGLVFLQPRDPQGARRLNVGFVGSKTVAHVDIDPSRKILMMTGQGIGERFFILSDERLLIKASQLGLSISNDPWVSFSAKSILGQTFPTTFDEFVASMSREVKECSKPDSSTSSVLDLLLGAEATRCVGTE